MNTTDATPAADRGSECNDLLGLAPERDAVLAQLDDTTNQTWVGKRARWARLVRAQDAEIARLRADRDRYCDELRQAVESLNSYRTRGRDLMLHDPEMQPRLAAMLDEMRREPEKAREFLVSVGLKA